MQARLHASLNERRGRGAVALARRCAFGAARAKEGAPRASRLRPGAPSSCQPLREQQALGGAPFSSSPA